jgi:hypothetical protein
MSLGLWYCVTPLVFEICHWSCGIRQCCGICNLCYGIVTHHWCCLFNIHRSVRRNIFLQYNQQDAPVISIYFCKTLYMFRTVFPSIIKSSKLLIQQRYMSSSCCYLLLSGMILSPIAAGSSSCLTYTIAVYAVLSS